MIYFKKQVDYALQLLLTLSKMKEGEHLSLRKFATERNISFLFLQRIAQDLKKAGLIVAEKGAHGGYRLGKSSEFITLKDVVEAVEGKYALVSCMKENVQCPLNEVCISKNALSQVHKDFVKVLENYTLQSLSTVQ